MKTYFKYSILLVALAFYFFIFSLCLWGKRVYGEVGNIEYLIAFHLLAVINYFLLSMENNSASKIIGKRSASFFLLHGCLISVFPYNGYLVAGLILMGASLIATAIQTKY